MKKNIKNLKISISGSQGIGKSTLMKKLVEKFGLTVLNQNTSETMKKYGFQNHSDVLKHCSNLGIDFQAELLENRLKLSKESNGFISDRSSLDYFTYFAIQNSMYVGDEYSKKLWDLTNEAVNDLDVLIYIHSEFKPLFGKLPTLQGNGIRPVSATYFNVVANVMNDLKNHLSLYTKGTILNDQVVTDENTFSLKSTLMDLGDHKILLSDVIVSYSKFVDLDNLVHEIENTLYETVASR